MKNLLIVVLAITIALGMATSAKAATFYLDTFLDEKAITGSSSWDADYNRFKADIPLSDEWKIGVDYMWGDVDDSVNTKINSYAVKFGYALINGDQAKLDLCAGYSHLTFDYPSDPDNDLSVVTLGVDYDLKLTERLGFNVGYDYGWGDYSPAKNKVTGSNKLDARLMFLFTENFGLSVGYFDYSFKPSGYPKIGLKGTTAGLVVKF